MERNQILSEIQSILRNILENDDIVITEDMKSKDIQGWDSLAHMNIIDSIENKYNIKFSIGEIVTLKNISDLITLILSKIS